ncbi:MAG TPA: type II toxin-antitoxin system VapC family toxin [Candidatus Rifleibacterium sp.]|nr:type II toxin-antitoxin system VapC family toxin [Candidatus Rifleibacterium sp.]HPT48333.1 type II toxin-antitoxin system VapC family toxin [Candidatus Rifleibacterium sp.]
MYCLDTNTCIYFLNGRFDSIRERILATPPGKIAIPAIVKAELLLGAYKSSKKTENTRKVERFLEPFAILPFADPETHVYAGIRAELERSGKCVGPNDLMIAAIVRHNNATLVTNNLKEFRQIKDLKLENWAV